MEWKAHILRSVNQEKAKEEMIASLNKTTVLIVMNWAMKFQQRKYREKQAEWFGKRGLCWHESSIISKQSDSVQVQPYIHLIDSYAQDWFSVESIFESVPRSVQKENPEIAYAYLRSDEAGCYHNNMLIAACHDVSSITGIKILAYNFSEPQNGKDICDRIICPLKAAVNKYCSEGHDILSSKDMYTALRERPVKGTTAAVAKIKDSRNVLKINKIDKFSYYHNFVYEKDGVRGRRAYGIGEGKLLSYKSIFILHQESSVLEISEEAEFFKNTLSHELPLKASCKTDPVQDNVFECPEPGCLQSFELFSDLDIHLDIGTHDHIDPSKESFFDSLKRDWAGMFSTISNSKLPDTKKPREDLLFGESNMCMGWALHSSSVHSRFPDHVKDYLIKRFDIGERTGNKADPGCVAHDMRNAKNVNGVRIFAREEWLKTSQIKGFFSRLAASRRKKQMTSNSAAASTEEEELNDDELADLEEAEYNEGLVKTIEENIGLQHPILYDVHNICEYYCEGKLRKLSVKLLKEILDHFEISYHSKKRKNDLLKRLESIVQECSCSLMSK